MNLSVAEVRRRFAGSPVARLATADAAGVPHIVPITFAVDGDTIWFAVDHKPKRSTDLRRLRNITQNPAVAVLADHYAADWSTLWWTRADGRARVHSAPDERAVAGLRRKYPQYAEAPPQGPLVTIEVHHWTGWAFSD
ncbi:TIGR03668 family PPOX class F420-dependent oxidoreductase [Streptomyces sp. NBC_01476]|uniref:TIGR03668 family PPOX class F420-dependent oxidoreductase n=1 Tax=Streptomyces sp. NBC_01476 TaxID=2903881 RepID=UPI002E3397E4|nr:TIGR03668 family PPOX class F420-dependent oxidoreductase [Streptomyces sp. NBC_01476]